ncbi:MAG TPA: 7TM diverse intracellular signaling domain-containing protein [Chitinophagaceae bacterium]|nr:7TM diverse intracellular signaling domain-containing protein [Chitinophagaceae bacterium]
MNPAAEQLYYYLLLFTLGSASLALFYHLVLYWQRNEVLLFQYCLYLFFLTAFLFSRAVLTTTQFGPDHRTWTFQFWDELLQLLLYYGYIEFVGKALDIRHNNHRWMFRIWKILAITILFIAVLHVGLMLAGTGMRNRYLFRSSRALLIILSLLVLIVYSFKNKTVFQRYILVGSLLFLISGSLAFASYVLHFQWGNFYALSFTFLGELADVLLFSAAMGYRLRQTYEEKEKAMKALKEQQELVLKKDIERMEAIVETRYHERNRIARELHDEVGSSLSSIHIFSTVANQPDKMAGMMEKIRDTSGRIMENMSDLVWAINAETDDMQSLLRRIRQFGASLLEAKNIELEVVAPEPLPGLLLKTEAKKNILLICKEAINNSAKYSQASRVIIEVQLHNGFLRLEIRDNGQGFMPGTNPGNGLVNMRKRCEESGGLFLLDTGHNKGTRINCEFPATTISN